MSEPHSAERYAEVSEQLQVAERILDAFKTLGDTVTVGCFMDGLAIAVSALAATTGPLLEAANVRLFAAKILAHADIMERDEQAGSVRN